MSQAGFSSQPRPDIMRFEHAKLLANLGDAVDALVHRDRPPPRSPRSQRGRGGWR